MHGAVSSPATLDTLSMAEGLFHISLSIFNQTQQCACPGSVEWAGGRGRGGWRVGRELRPFPDAQSKDCR